YRVEGEVDAVCHLLCRQGFRFLEEPQQLLGRITLPLFLQQGDGGRAEAVFRRVWVENLSAAEGERRGGTAQDEAIPTGGHHRLIQHELAECLVTGLGGVAVEEDNSSQD